MTSSLRRVDSLTITFLVDNDIEWMTKLPPGFTHELTQHIAHSKVDELTGVPTLDFDHFCCGAHGFSALIETRVGEEPSQLTLFDTGPDTLSLPRNIRAMQVDPNAISRVITSHWHSDHTGGLLSFLGLHSSPGCAVDVHPDRPVARGIAPGPDFDKVVCALPRDPTLDEIEKAGGKVERHAEGHAVAEGTVWVSGEIPRVTEFEGGLRGGMRFAENKWTPEPHIMDERYAAIDVAGKGLVLFSSCSHAGIVNVVKDAVQTLKRPVYMIVGGLHLAGGEFAARIPQTVDFLADRLRPSPTYVLPMHCTGFQAKIALEKALGEGCVPTGVGHRVDIVGNREDDERLLTPVWS
ncbi:beta-lactamase-like protein [Schizophyllum commune]